MPPLDGSVHHNLPVMDSVEEWCKQPVLTPENFPWYVGMLSFPSLLTTGEQDDVYKKVHQGMRSYYGSSVGKQKKRKLSDQPTLQSMCAASLEAGRKSL